MPRAKVSIGPETGTTRDAVIERMREGPVRVEVNPDPKDDQVLYLNPQTLDPGEEEIVTKRLAEAVLAK
jgi:hypothetical protein